MTATTRELPKQSRRKPFTWQRALLYVSLVLFAVAFMLPVYVLVITGLKSFA